MSQSPRVRAKNFDHWRTDSRVTQETGKHEWVYVYVTHNFRVDGGEGDAVIQSCDWEVRGRFRYTNEAEGFVIWLISDLEKAGYIDIAVHIKE